MRKDLVLVVMCVAMLFAAASSVSAQAPNDEYKATLEKMLELSGSMASAKAIRDRLWLPVLDHAGGNVPG